MSIFSGLTSAYSALQNRVNSVFGATPPVNMSLNSDGRSLMTPVRIDSGFIRTYDPVVNSVVRSSLSSQPSSALGAYSGGSSRSVRSPSVEASAPTAHSLDYLNADLARYYGMSRETAYSEALSNTAYQRAVKDMQAAGLNPAVLFGAGRASTADGVSYIKSASGGSGGGSGRHYGAGSSAKLFSQGAYGAISAAAGLVGMAVTKNPTGFWIGSQTAKGIMGALNALTK